MGIVTREGWTKANRFQPIEDRFAKRLLHETYKDFFGGERMRVSEEFTGLLGILGSTERVFTHA